MAADSPQDEISLEDLVGQVEGKSSPESILDSLTSDVGSGASDGTPKAAPSIAPADPSKVSDIDNLLAEEDPAFAASMTELQKQGGFTTDEPDIDPLDLEKLAKEKAPGRLRFYLSSLLRPIDKTMGEGHTLRSRLAGVPFFLLSLVLFLGRFAKDILLGLLREIKQALINFKNLPGRGKLIFALALAFGALAIFTLKLTVGDRANPFAVGTKFLKSFGDSADAAYSFDEHDPIDDFTDPLFHPEHVIMLDKFVVNLRRPSDGTNPMGLFEFYFEASNQDCAVELKDREGEARDVISRAIEQLSYTELMTAEGKEKLKVVLRKAVNSFLTRGQVRRVFIKTVVLKP
jgi:flagellar basal body-associated protein FliL